MRKFKNLLFSMTTTVILLGVFAVSIAYATFAESKSGTEYAKEIVYNAHWFEILMLLLVVNLVGSIFRYNLFRRKKWSILMFHFAFICMMAGATITRFFGYEGMMHIREGQTSNEISMEKPSVGISVVSKSGQTEKVRETNLSKLENSEFSESLSIDGKTITVTKETFMPNVAETIVPDEQGEPAVSVFGMNDRNEGQDFILVKGEKKQFEDMSFAIADSTNGADVLFSFQDDQLYFKSKMPLVEMGMMEKSQEELESNAWIEAKQRTIYQAGNIVFVIKSFMPKAKKDLAPISSGMGESGMKASNKNAIVFNVSDDNVTRKVHLLTAENQVSEPVSCKLGDVEVTLSYGMLTWKMPFSITLRKFEIERYPGSDSPSSYASEISVSDPEQKAEIPFRIFMNNILKYKGYRFFQTSYDEDEQGTILSVSHDYWGTFVSYTGYLLLLLGMTWTLFNKNSRFSKLLNMISEVQKERKSGKNLLLVLVLVFASYQAVAQNLTKNDHLATLNSLLVQDKAQGRIEPFGTLASDLLRKIYKKSNYNGKKPVEVIISMSTRPSDWLNERMIKVANPELAKELGAVNGYISYNQAYDFENNSAYRLKDKVEQVYHKPQSDQNSYDKEILNVDERINICYGIFNGEMPAFVPQAGNNKWLALSDLHNENEFEPAENQPESMLLVANYYKAVSEALVSGEWKNAQNSLTKLKEHQTRTGGQAIPSPTKVRLEILYNNINIFGRLLLFYILAGFFFLVLYLVYIFKDSDRIEKILKFAIYPFGLLLLGYTLGLVLRWYISGHAPWSNGYESMIFVGWAAALAGLVFAWKSPITLAVTGILSGIALSVAAMSWMNPEITNLVPVLKSYWLIIHVAIITSSYGFLAMGALLGLLNLLLMIARNKKNNNRLKYSILEIRHIIELTLLVGLFMLTVGCFIGGVWANESWGRYWGWDPKETWALVSILVYAIIIHIRKLPKADNPFIMSSLSVIGFSSVIMTFLGVNYYLTGMHSYAQGNAPTIPATVYVILAGIISIIGYAYYSERKNRLLK